MIGYFPEPYPDELLYSIIARFADRMRYPSKTAVAVDLFGTSNLNQSIEFPTRLSRLVENLPLGHSCTLDRLIWEHTMLPYYTRFLPSERVGEIESGMRGDYSKGWGDHARISPDKITQTKWLRFCAECAAHDRDLYCETYWHRSHQLPGCEVCAVHGVQLHASNVLIRDRAHLANLVHADTAVGCAELRFGLLPKDWYRFLQDISLETAWLLKNGKKTPVGTDTIRRRYRGLLHKLDLIDNKGRILHRKLNRSLAGHFPDKLLEYLGCDFNIDGKFSWVSQLASERYDHAQHPLQHLLMIQFLGLRSEEFFDIELNRLDEPQNSDRREAVPPFGTGPWPCLNPVCEHYRQYVIDQITVRRNQTNGCVEGMFACTCGFKYGRDGPDRQSSDVLRRDRIKEYGTVWEQHLMAQWENSTVNMREISDELGVSPMTVKRVAVRLGLPFPRYCDTGNRRTVNAGSEDALAPAERRLARLEEKRCKWLLLLEQYPDASANWLDISFGGIYSYLRRTDMAWLQHHLPANTANRHNGRGRRFRNSLVEQDDGIAQQVRRIAIEIRDAQGPVVRITRTAILSRIPQHVSFDVIERNLPLTLQCLNEMVESDLEYALRKLSRFTDECQSTGEFVTRSMLVNSLYLNNWVDNPVVKEAVDTALLSIGK